MSKENEEKFVFKNKDELRKFVEDNFEIEIDEIEPYHGEGGGISITCYFLNEWVDIEIN